MRGQPDPTRLVPVVLTAIGLTGCASSLGTPPAGPNVSPEPSATVAAAEAPPAANPFPGTTMRVGPGGDAVYCVKEIETGERIPKERCYTELAMKDMERNKRDDIEKMRERSGHTTLSGN